MSTHTMYSHNWLLNISYQF